MSVSVRPFGSLSSGEEVRAYTIVNSRGASCTVLDYGAIVQALCVPNRDGGLTDVVLGYDTAAGYENGHGHLGEIHILHGFGGELAEVKAEVAAVVGKNGQYVSAHAGKVFVQVLIAAFLGGDGLIGLVGEHGLEDRAENGVELTEEAVLLGACEMTVRSASEDFL